MKLPGGAGPDQYHTFTARLSAAGYRQTSMRIIAGCILSLGVPAALASAFPRTTPLPGGRAALALIAAACIVLAAPWLRHRWPSRTESSTVLVAGTLALTLGCLIPADPMAGLLVAVAFAFVLGFTAVFHSARLLMFPVVVATATILWLATRIAVRADLATAVAVSIPLTLLCVVTTFGCRMMAVVGGSAYTPTEIDPVTGLLTRGAFYERVATLLGARQRDDDRFLVITVAGVDGMSAIASIHGARGTNQAEIDAGQAIRETARRDAILGHFGGAEFLIADTFTTNDPGPLAERVRGAIAATPTGMTASVGVVSTPLRPLSGRPPQQVIDQLIGLATDAMTQARSAGGNRVSYVLGPTLSDEGAAGFAGD